MKLNELKQGMVCKLRNKEEIIILDAGSYYHELYIHRNYIIDDYNENFTHKVNKNLDIMEITFGDKVVFKRNESRWFVPEGFEKYFFTNSLGEVASKINMLMPSGNDVLNNNRVFKTKEEAEKRLKQQQATLSVERWIAENDVEVDVFDKGVVKYFIVFGIEDKELGVDCYNLYIATPKQFILSSVEKGLQLIKEREKELKIMFGVEE